ncbi:MAG: leucine--tRNA ligase [Candidatus Wildermuthbacteria bacterium RIFCSPHIGHO2_01_FULL_49_22b]|uniref:Leucine--tRNA ligase n=1 Tax=Candidatus Wildermuthbacteria bacterium RIFCSPHIGHO2_01_FULL_49_22b TaxID=1802448 RepID=A0A1G2QVS6_9BACT|nr:MAG: leucine--tRNA ligase [Candidatus Wildermuthbacteria bacterium RIFCSPHIGHO2_01_FULL_49_22b]
MAKLATIREHMERYNPQEIEGKWRRFWEKRKAWKVNLGRAKKPYYNLMMFPYPSAEGLHVGNVYAFVGSDIHGRFQRMWGHDVFEPIGFDSFGIHSENFAIKKGTHPKEQTAKNIKHFTEQLKQLGALFDWDRAVITSEPEYYKWTQWLFLQLYKAGLAYKGKAPVDWCPSCKTVLADEQVIEGKCERCDSVVLQKDLEQWFLRITKYADRLLKNLETIDWSEKTKIAQRNWIGRTEGTSITFKIENSKEEIKAFTTRADTLYGATFLVLAPEHPLIASVTSKGIQEYVEAAKRKTELERRAEEKEKTGVFTGFYAINPLNKEKIPVWVADYALMGYGTGALFGDAHDERDVEFARKYTIPLKATVITGDKKQDQKILSLEQCFTEYGILVDSGPFTGMTSREAMKKVTEWLTEKGLGESKVTYHLRDWLISRQRYWGPPIPVIYCRKCRESTKHKTQSTNKSQNTKHKSQTEDRYGIDYVVINGVEYAIVLVPEKDLPVRLPKIKDFRPTGTGKSPLASVSSFMKTKCPVCKGSAQRETDVSDTFLDSAWYFLRYPCTEYANKPFDKKRIKKWLPVSMYIGGHEHAVLHLLYTRFITMALEDMGYIEFGEPFKKFRAHGLITKEGTKMSKSRGNVVNPDEYFVKYGADTVRTYLMFLGPMAEGGDWPDKGIVGVYRFFNRLWTLVAKPSLATAKLGLASELASELVNEVLRHKTIKKVTEDLENLRYNTAIAALMEYFNALQRSDKATREQINTLLILLSPFAPHLTEELWGKLGNKGSIHNQPWPKYNPRILKEEQLRLVVQVNGRVREVLSVARGISEKEAVALALQQEKIKKWFPSGKPKNVVFIKGRLLNLVSY